MILILKQKAVVCGPCVSEPSVLCIVFWPGSCREEDGKGFVFLVISSQSSAVWKLGLPKARSVARGGRKVFRNVSQRNLGPTICAKGQKAQGCAG